MGFHVLGEKGIIAIPTLEQTLTNSLKFSFGAGVAPYVHRAQRSMSGASVATANPENVVQTTVGWVWAASVGAHYRNIFVEQSVYVVQNADNVVGHAGAFYPLTLGWRF